MHAPVIFLQHFAGLQQTLQGTGKAGGVRPRPEIISLAHAPRNTSETECVLDNKRIKCTFSKQDNVMSETRTYRGALFGLGDAQ